MGSVWTLWTRRSEAAWELVGLLGLCYLGWHSLFLLAQVDGFWELRFDLDAGNSYIQSYITR